MTDTVVIDTRMHGYERLTAAFLVVDRQLALVETGPRSSVDVVLRALDDAGVDDLEWIAVTHIHLDHAGAAGTLARRYPHATVLVHEVGAPHLADPTKLWASAARIYGEEMERLWGGIDAVPRDRIRVVRDGESVDLGARRLIALETPGHARHHHAFLDDASGILFAGDALGVRLPGTGVVRPATPPPEFHLEDALASIDRLAAAGATSLWFTHYGPVEGDVAAVCEEAKRALVRWAEWVDEARRAGGDLDHVARSVKERARADLEARVAPDAARRLDQATSYWMNTWGFMRYFEKRDEKARPR